MRGFEAQLFGVEFESRIEADALSREGVPCKGGGGPGGGGGTTTFRLLVEFAVDFSITFDFCLTVDSISDFIFGFCDAMASLADFLALKLPCSSSEVCPESKLSSSSPPLASELLSLSELLDPMCDFFSFDQLSLSELLDFLGFLFFFDCTIRAAFSNTDSFGAGAGTALGTEESAELTDSSLEGVAAAATGEGDDRAAAMAALRRKFATRDEHFTQRQLSILTLFAMHPTAFARNGAS